MAAKTIFVMLYTGAVTDRDRWIRPDQVTRMTDDQASRDLRRGPGGLERGIAEAQQERYSRPLVCSQHP